MRGTGYVFRSLSTSRTGFFPVQSAYPLHVLVWQLKIEDAEVFPHPFPVRRFGNHGNAQLDQILQGYLRRSLVVGETEGTEYGIAEEIVFPGGKGAPGLHVRTVLFHFLKQSPLLKEDMGLDLIDRRNHRAGTQERFVAGCVEIGNAYGLEPPGPVGLFQRGIHFFRFPIRLMDQQQVNEVELQGVQ